MPPPDATPDSNLDRLLCAGLEELGLGLDLAEPLAQLARLLDAWAPRINLTGHRGAQTIARRLLLDALALERQLPDAASLVDLGSGAGFPGIPIALVRPSSRIQLVESRERRHHFQRAAVRELGLANVEPIRGRAEELEPSPHALAVAQAMAAPDRAARWLLPWVEPGGSIAIPGAEAPPELASIPGLDPPQIVSYRALLEGPPRTLWLARRSARPA